MSMGTPELQQSSQEVVDTNKINEISTKIKELAETKDGNAETQKQLNDSLTENVLNMLTNLDDAAKGKLKDSIILILESHRGEAGFESANQGLVKLAESLGLKKDEEGVWRENDISTSIEVGKEKYEEWLKLVESNITALLDDVIENDSDAVSELLSQKIDSNFCHGLIDYFLDNQGSFEDFKIKLLGLWDNAVEKALPQINGIEDENIKARCLRFVSYINSIKDDVANMSLDVNRREEIHKNIDENLKDKVESLIEIGMKIMRDVAEGSQEVVDNTVELPKSPLNGSLEGIEAGEEGKRDTKLWSDLVRNRQDDNNLDQGKKLYLTTEKIADQLKKITDFMGNDRLKDTADIAGIKAFLENVQMVIDNTSENNVRILQQYIRDNLDGQDQRDFESKSLKKGGNFDGRFGEGTLAGLNKVLENTGKYIEDISNQLAQIEAQENSDQEKLNKVTVNQNVKVKKGSAVEAKDLVLGVAEGVDVSFVEGKEITANEAGTHTGQVKLKVGNKERTLDVKLIVEEGEKSVDTISPLTTVEGQYLVMVNNSELAQNIGLGERAVFYSAEAQRSPVVAQNGKWETRNVPNEGDYNCILQIDGQPNKTYLVKVDQNGNLCPVATNLSSKVPVVFENNRSCMNYLYNKLPSILKNNGVYIGRDGKDYGIGIKGEEKYLTIEPMTIDNKWVGKNLTESLAFLNLSNYLRNKKELQDVEFINNNPNLKLEGNELYVRVKKNSNVTYDANGKVMRMGGWLKIDKSSFGLQDSELKNLRSYINYNNNEQWEHSNKDWERDERNRYYRPVKLS